MYQGSGGTAGFARRRAIAVVLKRLAWQLPCPDAVRQLGVEANPPPDPVAGISGGGTVSLVAVGTESTPGSAASGAHGTARTTGGNSGSPTLNAHGELVGLLFDGTYESVISDWDFLPDVTRSIHVDIRYALWVMDYVDDAEYLVREMNVTDGDSARK